MYCRKCGGKIDEDAKFCPICGNKIERGNEIQPDEITSSEKNTSNLEYRQEEKEQLKNSEELEKKDTSKENSSSKTQWIISLCISFLMLAATAYIVSLILKLNL